MKANTKSVVKSGLFIFGNGRVGSSELSFCIYFVLFLFFIIIPFRLIVVCVAARNTQERFGIDHGDWR